MNTENLVLRPNCLLTRWPLVFITGPRSLFHSEKLGQDLQDYLTAHGYQVLCPPMPFRGTKARQQQLRKWLLSQSQKRFHFILGEDSANELAEILKLYSASDLTLLPGDFKTSSRPTLNYKLHGFLCRLTGDKAHPFEQTLPDHSLSFYDRFLDHCIELAENDAL